jgi:hypothetical protein
MEIKAFAVILHLMRNPERQMTGFLLEFIPYSDTGQE